MRLAQSDLITQYVHSVVLLRRQFWPERHVILPECMLWQEDKHVEEICGIASLFFVVCSQMLYP